MGQGQGIGDLAESIFVAGKTGKHSAVVFFRVEMLRHAEQLQQSVSFVLFNKTHRLKPLSPFQQSPLTLPEITLTLPEIVTASPLAALLASTFEMIPDIPLDIFGVIAEFLAGSCAFGTLASLNAANRLIREETLPVLYETLLMDDEVKWPRSDDGELIGPVPPETSLASTKYCIRAFVHAACIPPDIGLNLPNVLCTIIANTQYDDDGQPCTLLLHKPVTAHTLIRVICKTPVRSKVSNGRGKPRSPVIGQIRRLEDVLFHPAGKLRPSRDHPEWMCDIRITRSLDVRTADAVSSLLELLKLQHRHRSADATRTPSDGRILGYKLVYGLGTSARALDRWEILVVMDINVFVDFFQMFVAAVNANPTILRTGVMIQIEASSDDPELSNTIRDILPIFDHQMKSKNAVKPVDSTSSPA